MAKNAGDHGAHASTEKFDSDVSKALIAAAGPPIAATGLSDDVAEQALDRGKDDEQKRDKDGQEKNGKGHADAEPGDGDAPPAAAQDSEPQTPPAPEADDSDDSRAAATLPESADAASPGSGVPDYDDLGLGLLALGGVVGTAFAFQSEDDNKALRNAAPNAADDNFTTITPIRKQYHAAY